MKTMKIYEPAMCCPTGLCGVSIDPELMRISSVVDTLAKNGVKVERFNLSSFPQEFVKNADVNKRIRNEGVEVLPLVVVDGEIVITKRYPRNDEFIKLLGLSDDFFGETEAVQENSESTCCCSGSGCC